jgi:serine/threonine-protein kinase
VLPTLTGRSQEAATTLVTRLGLRVGTVTRVYSARPAGEVVGVGAPAGTRLRPGSPVNLTVSKGPELLAVPSQVGQGQDGATAALRKAGFAVAVEQVFSETVPPGVVVAQDPPGGQLPRAGTVSLQVSRGPERITVPDLSGLSDAQARARLEGLGLGARGVRPPLFGGDTVSRQDPSAGERVKRGRTVTYLLT